MRLVPQNCSPCLGHGCHIYSSVAASKTLAVLAAKCLHTGSTGVSKAVLPQKHAKQPRSVQKRDQGYQQQQHRLPSDRSMLLLENLRWGHAIPFDAASMAPKNDATNGRSSADGSIRDRRQPFKQDTDATGAAQAYIGLSNTLISTEQPPLGGKDGRQQRQRQHADSIGKSMPSSIMHRLNIKFYADIKRRRQRQGLRIRILAVLSELRHLIQVCGASRDSSQRVYRYIEDLNNLYVEYLQAHAQPLYLRAGTYVTVTADGNGARSQSQGTMVAVVDSSRLQLTRIPTDYRTGCSKSPLLERERYCLPKKRDKRPLAKTAENQAGSRKGGSDLGPATDPCIANWIDYLVDDLSEAEAHKLFCLVARSKVPTGISSKYATAIEEALVFAFNRAGYMLDALESLRVCAYFLRQKSRTAQIQQLLFLWRSAGEGCFKEIHGLAQQQGTSSLGDTQAAAELRFKRWSDVASMLIVSLCRDVDGLQPAWALLGQWHMQWTRVMQVLCPIRRRGFASGTDHQTYPYWRPKQPGQYRLHDLTLSATAVCSLLAKLVHAGEENRAAELLGFATSEVGTAVSTSMFNILLQGYLDPPPSAAQQRSHQHLHSLSEFPLTNVHSIALYTADNIHGNSRSNSDPGSIPAEMSLLLRGMARWGITPDWFTLQVLVSHFCHQGNARMLRRTLYVFAAKWRVLPTRDCWEDIKAYGMYARELETRAAALAQGSLEVPLGTKSM
ncbi:hypothetical protein GQ54DRAFT_294840 [Martensiomyces pterosporus]|nr:hypothetical protein GQ54DRAFT_294840 [Martensiomyces pterosporus]